MVNRFRYSFICQGTCRKEPKCIVEGWGKVLFIGTNCFHESAFESQEKRNWKPFASSTIYKIENCAVVKARWKIISGVQWSK